MAVRDMTNRRKLGRIRGTSVESNTTGDGLTLWVGGRRLAKDGQKGLPGGQHRTLIIWDAAHVSIHQLLAAVGLLYLI